MTDFARRGPMGQKAPKPDKPPRKGVKPVSDKRKAFKASTEGKAGLAHMARVKTLPCVICHAPPPSDAHHCYHGRYGAAKESDFDTIPLCKWCHQVGPLSVHKAKATWREMHGPDYEFLPIVAEMLRANLLTRPLA